MHDAVAILFRPVGLVQAAQDGHALGSGDIADQRQNPSGVVRIQAGCRRVEEEGAWRGEELDGDAGPLALPAAQGADADVGVLGVGLHSAGSIAKLWAEAVETAAPEPLDAIAATGAGRLRVILYALLPDVLPSLASILLYVWEFNVRASTVLGIVGAGGIGQELKSAIDLLDFPRVLAIILVVLVMVTAIDQASAWARRRLA